MADIAFLLLIFFLVTTTIETDQGITVKLPPWDPNPVDSRVNKRNVLAINLNLNDQLLVRDELIQVEELVDRIKEFVLNPNNNDELSSAPNKAIVAYKCDRNSTYDAYIQVYDRIKTAYREMWSDIAMRDYGIPYNEEMPSDMRQEIRAQVPFIVSESESSDYGEPD